MLLLIEVRSALVTGIDGFTGPYVKASLTALGYKVYGITHGAENNETDLFNVDLVNLPEVTSVVNLVRPDVVIHLAAISFVAGDNIDDMYAVNIVGTRNLLQALTSLARPPKSIILASSANIYGNNTEEFLDENTKLAPKNDYAVSKLAMEMMAELWSKKLPITVVRPFNYTGVGQSDNFLIPKIISHFANKASKIELGNIDVYRDFSDVRMVADVYAALADKEIAGESFNVCSGRIYSLDEILHIVADISGHTLKVEINPLFVRENEIKQLGGNRDKLDQLLDNLTDYSMIETLRWMYQSAID